MSDLKCARMLVEAAERDFSALRGMGEPAVFADEVFGFHAQQATEKLLKAWIALLGEVYPLTHNIARLLGVLKACGVEVAAYREMDQYSPYAVRFRYTGIHVHAKALEREEAILRVQALLEHVRRQLTEAEGA